tara:strand:+ start:2587 stop:3240 length:654 start_codon:yes stop_codon:yes gene_type:complete
MTIDISNNLDVFLETIPSTVELVAVSKTKPNDMIMEAYQAGQRHFGENKIQEMTSKWETLPKDIQWHMIGHVQTNKVKYMAPYVSLIHGVDREKLLNEINKQAFKNNRIIDCLLQVFIANENTKFGLFPNEILPLIEKSLSLKNIRVAGLMGMATFTQDSEQIENEFKILKELFFLAQKKYNQINILSMGMSNDYQIAINQESNMIRIGSKIFGSRD